MSGHSKWATTKRKKAVIDAKRGKIFTKLAKLITIAARDGKSGDVAMNPSLRMAVENARAASMPKDNIDRAIQRGIGGAGGAEILEINYEAYAPHGIALLIECLTDNKNRTLGEIKAVLNKSGGSLASAGSVAYQFSKVGQFVIDENKNELKGDDLEFAIIDSGASDFEKDENFYVVTASFENTQSVKKGLEEADVIIDSTDFVQITANLINLPEDQKNSVADLIDKLDDLDDVNNVYSNLDL